MIYTIGIKENYDKYILDYGDKCEKEIGGSVWEFPELAAQYVKNINRTARKPYAVYGVELNWDYDTTTDNNCLTEPTYRKITKRGKIVKLND